MEKAIKGNPKTKCFNLLKQAVIYSGIFCILLMPFLKEIRSKPFFGDEYSWLKSSIYFKLFFIDKDISNRRWRSWHAYDQPPFGKYIIGLMLYVAGSMSTNTGIAPHWVITSAVAIKVKDGVITSSPGPMP